MPKTKEQCEQIREAMRKRILEASLSYFAKNGFAGTKISELARHIGIGQGTMYSYFSSKEDLFEEISKQAGNLGLEGLQQLNMAPIRAKQKIQQLSESMYDNVNRQTVLAYLFVFNMKYASECGSHNSFMNGFEKEPNQILAGIIRQGQEENMVIEGEPEELADLYWSVVHILAWKKIFESRHDTIGTKQLTRLLIKDDDSL